MNMLTITIYKSDIFFDVDAVTHVFADVKAATNAKMADAMESDTDDTANASLIRSFADARAAQLKHRLARFLNASSGQSQGAANSAHSSGNYTFTLSVENGFINELAGDLAKEMKSYISNGVIADWYASIGSEQASVYTGMLAPSYTRIVDYIVERKFPSRI